ncbi:serine protease [Sinimarinibacterium sp. NLF-5-8]|uniref:trypsin-like serine peptidase n=1 Tax=Sinimarinibacterium sp. NLF-5-8 TaxID=2698684 RepID=UPI00137C166B|nr:trypsin-like peptidase domain-containing protein [Sinimarinibacterium sp. NLF-5-8]QHS09347.1 trypsin-like serine protease [Sinimarinibacterium sp. NLF-5-8]
MHRWSWLLGLCGVSFSAAAWQPTLSGLELLPLHVAEPVATAKAQTAAASDKGHGPAVFAVTVPLPVTLDGGVWDTPEPGVARWHTRIFSATAQNLLMVFDQFDLPAHAQLWLYDDHGSRVQGPYSRADQPGADGTLWTATVPGDTAIVELRVPATQRDAVRLTLGRIGHGFKNTRDLGSAGQCNIDTSCPLGTGWRNEMRAVVKLQIPSPLGLTVGLCSGTLVNNTAANGRPFILTANHCGITRNNAANVIAYWNFANSTCNVNSASDQQNQRGANLRTSDKTTDMALIELAQQPAASLNVYYSGWDASGNGARSGVGIHHPSGDARKISEFTIAVDQQLINLTTGGLLSTSPTVPTWRVQRWSQGATEQGSSGSGLWNQDHRLIGTLSGGAGACNGSVNNGQADYYARLDQQWVAGLQPFLDPANSGQLQLGGMNAPAAASPSAPGNDTGTTPPASGSTTDSGSGTAGGGAIDIGSLSLLLLLARRRRRQSRLNTPP